MSTPDDSSTPPDEPDRGASPYGAPPGPSGAPTGPYGARPSPRVEGGGSLGAGIGIGCGGAVVAVLAGLWLVSAVLYAGWTFALPALVLLAVSIILFVNLRTRRLGLGMLIVVAASFLVVIGPCTVLMNG